VRLQIKGTPLSAAEQKLLENHVRRLEKRLGSFDPDLVDLELALEKQARREEFTSHARLVIMNQVLPSRRNAAPTIRTLLGKLFEDLEEEVARWMSQVRGEESWKRRRKGSRDSKRNAAMAGELVAERALLTQALQGDRKSFDQLAEERLSGVRKVIYDLLSVNGREPDDDALNQALNLTLSRAFENLDRKPENWSVRGWLAWTARKELRRAVRAGAG
jgi:hypothetical protein